MRAYEFDCRADSVKAVYQHDAVSPNSNLNRRQFVEMLLVKIKVLPLAVGECVLALLYPCDAHENRLVRHTSLLHVHKL